MADLFVGQFGVVVTVSTNADMSAAQTNVFLNVEKPDTDVCAALQDNGNVFTNYLREANDKERDDVQLLPSGAIAVDDAFYVGFPGRYTGIDFDVKNEGVGTWIVVAEYWDGASWTAFVNPVDDTNNFMVQGINRWGWDMPTDWELDVVDNEGAFYFARFRVITADTNPSQQPLANQISIGKDTLTGTIVNATATNDPSDANYSTDYGKFTVTISDGTFDVAGTYFVQARVTVSTTGVFYGKTDTIIVKEEFAQ